MASSTSPSGLGGWLLVVGFILLLIPIKAVVVLFSGAFASNPFSVFGELLFAAYALVLLFLFVRKSRLFPRLFMGLWLGALAWRLLEPAVLHPSQFSMAPIDAIGASLLGCAIWIPYTLTSRRVKATFGGDRAGGHQDGGVIL